MYTDVTLQTDLVNGMLADADSDTRLITTDTHVYTADVENVDRNVTKNLLFIGSKREVLNYLYAMANAIELVT